MLGPAGHVGGHALGLQLGEQDLPGLLHILLAPRALLGDLAHQPPVGLALQVFEGLILQLPLDLGHAEAPGQRRIDLARLQRLTLLFVRFQRVEGAHIVQAVGQLDHDDTGVLGHGHEHLLDVIGLATLLPVALALAVALILPLLDQVDLLAAEVADLGDAVDQVRHGRPEARLHLAQRRIGVLDHVVQQAGHDGGGVHAHLRQDDGRGQRMDDVGLARFAAHPLVGGGGEVVGVDDGGAGILRDVGARGGPQRLQRGQRRRQRFFGYWGIAHVCFGTLH